MHSSPRKILVVGSINMDLVIRCERLPKPGETKLAIHSSEICGGKGANQAVAAARAGGSVSMIGRVGDDAFAPKLLENLRRAAVDTTGIHSTPNTVSGTAIVAVEESGENMILVVPGANGRVDREDILMKTHTIQESDIVLLQLEIPLDTVQATIRLANHTKRRVILNPAPYSEDFEPSFYEVDLFCPNSSEASSLLNRAIDTVEDAKEAAVEFHRRGAKHVVITLGEFGAVLLDDRGVEWIEPFDVVAVDTTAAGDAFCGAMAVRWSEGADFREAVRFGCAAGALAATREGAQPSLPTRTEINAFLATHSRGHSLDDSQRDPSL